MKTICIWVLLAGSMLLTLSASSADSTETVKHFMEKVQQAYKKTPYLSFHLLYKYANKDQPTNYIDTIAGDIAMDKNRMRFVLDNVETVTNDKYTIRVMKEDKLIYLSAAQPMSLADPVNRLDSVLAHLNGVRIQIVRNKKLATLNIAFPPGQQYKNIAMTIDESTGYFQKVVYELYTAGMVEQDQLAQPGNAGPYQSEGRVEVVFSNYRQGRFNDSLFDESLYLTRLGKGNYEPSEQYKGYQIFLASSNL